MLTKVGFPAVVAILALAGAPVAFAATTAGARAAPTARTSTVTPAAAPGIHYVRFSDRVSGRDIAAFGASKLTLDQAITAAEGQLHGKVVEAAFRGTPDHPHYVVRMMENGRVLTASVDGANGQVTRLGHGVSVHRLYPAERAEFLRTADARMNLANAVAFAQRDTGDRPIAASLEGNHNTRGYEVFVVHKNLLQTVWVSPDNWPMTAMK